MLKAKAKISYLGHSTNTDAQISAGMVLAGYVWDGTGFDLTTGVRDLFFVREFDEEKTGAEAKEAGD